MPTPSADDLKTFRSDVDMAVEKFAADYAAYFERNAARSSDDLTMLDPVPRVAYVPGIGLFGIGRTAKEASICADIAEATVSVITGAERVGTWSPLPEEDIFDVEYWSLEQAKLAGVKEAAFNRKVVAVTGAASGLGLEISKTFKALGAEVAMLDRDEVKNADEARKIGAYAVPCDVTDPSSVDAAYQAVASEFGGLDILISNAGIALQGAVETADLSVLRQIVGCEFSRGVELLSRRNPYHESAGPGRGNCLQCVQAGA